MIPGPLFSWPQLLLLLYPFVAELLGAGLLLYGLSWQLRNRHLPGDQRPRFWRASTMVFSVIAVVGCLWGVFLQFKSWQFQQDFALQTHYRQSRQQFVLPQDFQYGELLIPKGSLINRYDAFDNGEPQRPLRMSRLDAVRFAHPVQVAGTWASAMNGGVLELVRDQRIGPVFHFDDKAQDGYGGWVLDPSRPYLECKKGQQARFNVPLIDYNIEAEFGKPEPDGTDARFQPSQWAVTECTDSEPIEVKPAYTDKGPKETQTEVWGPLQPSRAGRSPA